MAQILKRLVSKRNKYDWNLWADGRAYRAIKGKDFKCSVAGFRSALYQIARRRQMKVQVTADDKTVAFQFHKQ